jgi:phosphoserine phosphatase
MNVYDFDDTIYKGQSWIDFYLYCQSRSTNYALVWLRAFKLFFFGMIKYRLGFTKFNIDNRLCNLIRLLPNLDELVDEFWDKNMDKIESWYMERYKNNETINDVIISVSPDFLLKNICKRLNVGTLICTNVDLNSGSLIGTNLEKNKAIGVFCADDEKTRRFKKMFPNEKIESFYTDSYHDQTLIDISKHAYIKDKRMNRFKKIK